MTDRGFVLLNALILVMGMAGIATLLLTRAVDSTQRLAQMRDRDQADLYIDAGLFLLEQVLERDFEEAPEKDHLGELWATQGYTVTVDRGVLSGRIDDMQGRFNVNWLTDPDDWFVASAFQRMVQDVGLPQQVAAGIRDYLRPGGPANARAYENRDVPLAVSGGPIIDLQELRAVPSMTNAYFDRLAPLISALPADTPLNVNTAPAAVLAAVMPSMGLRGAQNVVTERKIEPFNSVGDFSDRMAHVLAGDALDGFGSGRLSVKSAWFSATIRAKLDTTQRGRWILFNRSDQNGVMSLRFKTSLL